MKNQCSECGTQDDWHKMTCTQLSKKQVPPMDLKLQAALTRTKEQRTKALKRAARAEEEASGLRRKNYRLESERDNLLRLIDKHNKSLLGALSPIDPKKWVY